MSIPLLMNKLAYNVLSAVAVLPVKSGLLSIETCPLGLKVVQYCTFYFSNLLSNFYLKDRILILQCF